MIHLHGSLSRFLVGTMFLTFFLFPVQNTVNADPYEGTPTYSPVVNGEALRGLSTVTSAESMGEGRITFDFLGAWYKQQTGYFNTPVAGAHLFTGTGAFSYGVNSTIDVFMSIAAFASSNYTNTNKEAGLGTIRAGVQGSLPFPKYAFVRMGGQAAIIGGTSSNQINTYRVDGYNYFETRTGYDLSGKLMQTLLGGGEDWGIKLHLNEAGIVSINESDPALLLLGAGLQANLGIVVLGGEINSRTRFNDLSFKTDPVWATPSIHIRTPYNLNVMAGVDIALSKDRSYPNPRALEPYRVFGSVAFSFDVLADKRNAEHAQKVKDEQDKKALQDRSAQSAKQVDSLTAKSMTDSIAFASKMDSGSMQLDSLQRRADSVSQANKVVMNSMQRNADSASQANKVAADVLAKKATVDSLALITAANNLAIEKEKRTDAEKKLLSTGELLLDAVYFETGKTVISINSKPYLNIIGKMLAKYPKLQIEVAGYTDNIGSEASNIELSQGRADAVRMYLIEVAPLLSTTLIAHGYGMKMPKADNKSAKGRLANRRVELRVVNKNALLEYGQN
jgi:OOP family OmpA-OmpF porin